METLSTQRGGSASTHMRVRFDEQRIDALFADLNQDLSPGAAVGIAIGRQTVYRKAFGLANAELPVPLTPTMRMRVGSITKHFTCLAYLLLCEDGRADLDDRVGDYLPELHPTARDITVRQLMGHVSGLRDALEISWQFSGTGIAVSSADLLALYRDIDEINAAPGTSWIYNNGGYLILSAIVERITRLPLAEVLKARILDPVGMYHSLLRPWDTDFLPNSATLHMMSATGAMEKAYLGTALGGEGGLVSTVDDMLKWLAHMTHPTVGSRSTWDLMSKPFTLANGTSTGYGLGLMNGRYRDAATLYHSGSVMGGNAQMLKLPAAELDIIVMTNRHDVLAMSLVDRILDTCLPGSSPASEPPQDSVIWGVFRAQGTGEVIQLFGKNSQQMVSLNGYDIPFLPQADGVLRPASVWSFLKYELTAAEATAAPLSICFTDFGNRIEMRRQQPARSPYVSPIIGTYESPSTGTVATISSTDEGARLHTRGRFGVARFELECLAERIWRAKSLGPMSWGGGILDFNGPADRFALSTPRERLLSFKRRD